MKILNLIDEKQKFQSLVKTLIDFSKYTILNY